MNVITADAAAARGKPQAVAARYVATTIFFAVVVAIAISCFACPAFVSLVWDVVHTYLLRARVSWSW